MDPRNMKADKIMDIWVKLPSTLPRFDNVPARFEYMGNRGYILSQNNKNCVVKLRDPQKAEELDYYLTRGGAKTAFVSGRGGNDELMLTLFFFSMPVLEIGSLSIGVKPELLKKGRDLEVIRKDCIIKLEGQEYFQLCPHSDGEGLAIVGETMTLPLEKEKTSSGEIYWLNKISRTPEESGGIHLARGRLDLRNMGDETVARDFARSQLDALLQRDDSYLAVWDKYCAEEGRYLLNEARKTGAIRYISVSPTGKGFQFELDAELEHSIPSGTTLAMFSELPGYLANPEMTYEEYFRQEEEKFQSGIRNNAAVSGNVILAKSRAIEVEMSSREMYPPTQGYLAISIAGDLIQMQRKFKARQSIREGRCANPCLGLIIEENGVLPHSTHTKAPIPALSETARSKIFSHPPTPMQEKAVGIAINTPDIAIIQGPPGTGKTTVIAAIVERLNEMMDPESSSGAILVSSYQHDAVDNLVNKIFVNSLPTLKFSRRNGKDTGSGRIALANWQKELVTRLNQKYPDLAVSAQAKTFRQIFRAYIINPCPENEKRFLEEAMTLPASWRDEEIEHNIQVRLAKLGTQEDTDKEALRSFVYGLRETPQAYSDDGLLMASRVLVNLANFLDAQDRDLLEQTPDNFPNGAGQYFREIGKLKNRLQDRLLPDLQAHRPYPREEIVELMGCIEKKMGSGKTSDESLNIISDFIYSLEHHPRGVDKTLADFNVVYASTVQQAEGHDISAVKARLKKEKKGRAVTYDTVIIDETARSSPMDLLIPMSQGRRRIILVGDHKQLPHIVEKGIIDAMDCGEEEKDMLEESMFEYLVRRAQALSEKDGKPRFAQLDAQYRMHPLLGELVSHAFYEGSVSSPLGAEHFQQELPAIAGLAAVWFNVPFTRGGGEKYGTSWQRRAEALEIISRLKQWLEAPQSRGLSFGVITFYKAQKELILHIAAQEGLLTQTSDGEYVLDHKYADSSVTEKLRINTVDAFQGKEFDIVLLSMVRSAKPGRLGGESKKEGMARFGHLCLPNRLCVALSRQKRFLGIVGDKSMLEDKTAAAHVPALVDFLNLCHDAGAIFECGGVQ